MSPAVEHLLYIFIYTVAVHVAYLCYEMVNYEADHYDGLIRFIFHLDLI